MQDSKTEVFDTILEGCVIFRRDLTIAYINDAACLQAKGSREDFIDRPWTESVPNIEKTFLYRSVNECFDSHEPRSVENQYFYPDRSYCWFLLKLHYADDKVYALSIDITAFKQSELEKSKQIERIEALRNIDLSILNMNDIKITMETIAKRIVPVLGVDATTLMLFNSDGNLEYYVGEGLKQRALQKDNILLDRGYLARVMRTGETIIDNDIANNQEFLSRRTVSQAEQFKAYAVTPLRENNKIVGLIEVMSKEPFALDGGWVAFFKTFSEQVGLAIKHSRLIKGIEEKSIDLESSYDKTIEGWSKALELKDNETKGHTVRVAALAVQLGRQAGFSTSEIKYMRWGALLHDIGKIGIPDSILNKPGALTLEERFVIMKHPIFAKELLDPIEYLRQCIDIPYCHHENYDGSGYPQGLSGDSIPLAARLFSVIDVWDALAVDRPYRKAWNSGQIKQHLLAMKNKQFDPYAVDLFLAEFGPTYLAD